jgi:hypothetical protein
LTAAEVTYFFFTRFCCCCCGYRKKNGEMRGEMQKAQSAGRQQATAIWRTAVNKSFERERKKERRWRMRSPISSPSIDDDKLQRRYKKGGGGGVYLSIFLLLLLVMDTLGSSALLVCWEWQLS